MPMRGLFAIQKSDDWPQFALNLPMATVPGERCDHSNIGTFLLSAILVNAPAWTRWVSRDVLFSSR